MIQRLRVAKKLELLAFIPMLAFGIVLTQFSYFKYQELNGLKAIKQQYQLFQVFDSTTQSLESLRLHISLGELHNLAGDKLKLTENIDQLKPSVQHSSIGDTSLSVQSIHALIESLVFIVEMEDDELLADEWSEIIKEAIASIHQISVKTPVLVSQNELRNNNEKYLLLQKLHNNVAEELNYFVLLLNQIIELDELELASFSYQQQSIIDTYLNRYASEVEIQKLLEAFNHRAFKEVVNLRASIVERYSGSQLTLSAEEINIIDQRSKRINSVIIDVRNSILKTLESNISASMRWIFLNAALLLLVISLVIYLSLKIRKRIVGSLDFIGRTLEGIEKTKDYSTNIIIEGADEFSQLSQILATLVRERAVSEFEMIAAKEVAEQANRAKSAFLANMSHEIRTPLNGILGMSDILQKTDMSLSQKSHLKTIRSSSKILLNLINDILDVSKIESNSLNIARSESSLFMVVDDVVSIVAPKLQSGEVELGLDYPLNIHTIFLMDDYRVQQVILNLVSNAVKFSPGGKVFISISHHKATHGVLDELSIVIKDTGIGMSEEQQATIFEPFKQADDSITRKFQGTGLGLTISSRLTALMDGEIKVTSVLGEGSEFTLLLPVESIDLSFTPNEEAQEEPVCLHRLKAQPAYWLRGLVICLVGQETDSKAATLQFLMSTGATVTTEVKQGESADLMIVELDSFVDKNQLQVTLSTLNIGSDTVLLLLYPAHITMDMMSLSELGIENYYQLPVRGEKLAKFIIELCVDEDTAKVAAINTLAGLRALVIEDDPTNQMVAELCLEEEDIIVTLADDGLEGFEAFKEGTFDFILMDCMMPVMDGIHSTEHIRAFEEENKLNHMPIIALTASVLNDDINNCFRAGMDAYVHKPFELSNLLQQIERVVEEFPMREK